MFCFLNEIKNNFFCNGCSETVLTRLTENTPLNEMLLFYKSVYHQRYNAIILFSTIILCKKES